MRTVALFYSGQVLVINIPAVAEALIKFVTKQLTVTTENQYWQRHHFCQQHTSRTPEQEFGFHYGECKGTNPNTLHLGEIFYHIFILPETQLIMYFPFIRLQIYIQSIFGIIESKERHLCVKFMTFPALWCMTFKVTKPLKWHRGWIKRIWGVELKKGKQDLSWPDTLAHPEVTLWMR